MRGLFACRRRWEFRANCGEARGGNAARSVMAIAAKRPTGRMAAGSDNRLAAARRPLGCFAYARNDDAAVMTD